MSIAPTCDRCHHELSLPGALLFSPPNLMGDVRKYHICVACYAFVHDVATGGKVLP